VRNEMVVMGLMKLGLRNFKGVRNFLFEPNGGNSRVFGDNATGKTTLFDAFTWLLFGKDSQNKQKFDIKTLDEDNNVIHGLDHEVEGVFELNGTHITLKRVYSEDWTKKKGSVDQVLTGHSTVYFIDGVPVKMKEYEEEVAKIVAEETFKLLTSPTYFNEHLDKSQRRQLLMKISGDISDVDVIASNKSLKKLPSILENRSLERHKSMIVARRKKINEELEKIPVRVNEVQRAIPDIAGMSEEALLGEITLLKKKVSEKESEMSRIQSGSEITVKENRMREISGELLDIKNKIQSDTLEKVSKQRREVATLQDQVDDIEQEIRQYERKIQSVCNIIGEKEEAASLLRARWKEVYNAPPEVVHSEENCATCGQSLPLDQVKEAHDKAVDNANKKQSDELERISADGRKIKSDILALQSENEEFAVRINVGLTKQFATKKEDLEIENAELIRLQSGLKDVESDPEYIEKTQKLKVVQSEIDELRSSVDNSLSSVKTEIGKVLYDIDGLEQDKAKFVQVKASNKRIEELMDEERVLAEEFEKLEEELYLTEEFTRTKATLLETRINSNFKYARFKLFNRLLNGGVEECCETMFKGVPYSSGLNNAGRINVDLDIINTLSKHYRFSAPIFIDNSEAVTKLIDIDAQIIGLVVSESDKQLRVESQKLMEVL
jgi:DNA repair exonuclease SbcCD ATPase subunit